MDYTFRPLFSSSTERLFSIGDYSSFNGGSRPSTRSSNGTSSLINERQLSDTGPPTIHFVLFENKASKRFKRICFLEYQGTRARKHHSQKLFLPQMVKKYPVPLDETYEDFAGHVKQVLESIPPADLSSYIITVRTGVFYFFSKRFRFGRKYTIEEMHDLLGGMIPLSDEQFYFPPRTDPSPYDHTLRSSFANIKPISRTDKFVEKLNECGFHVKTQKYLFRIYLQSDDKQRHVCTIDPGLNYSIVEFSKDLQRTSNIGKSPSDSNQKRTASSRFHSRSRCVEVSRESHL